MKKSTLILFVVLTLGISTNTPLFSQSVQLPIEIMGPEGATESVTVDVEYTSGITGLWIQAHNLSYDNKGSIQLNNGDWIALTNASVSVAEPEVHIGGIGGGYSTIRLTVPIDNSDLVEGTNTIAFRFNETDGMSNGWRVLQFNFVRSDGSKILPESLFVEEDPALWEPILKDAADIAEGEYLWYNAALLVSPDGNEMKARCADCHATDGRDLKYFNYSDKSIITRSEFHGLTTLQGQQIASFIRTIDAPAPGRPWNPPYQPGPGLDDRPVEEWAAGAGLEWVLDSDGETLDYIFPDGITSEVASTNSTLNMRELPLALQFPDWNRWLPPVHPVDFWGDDFLASDAWNQYSQVLASTLAQGVDNAIQSGVLRREIQNLDSDVSDFREHTPRPAGATGQEHAAGNLGLQLWQLVKVWEIMQAYEIEDRGKELYPYGEERTWFSASRNVFNVAPHISGAGGPDVHTYGSVMLDKFFSHSWYMYQIVLNPGNRDPLGHRPVDWKYQFGHIGDYAKQTGLPGGSRIIATYIKMIQMLDNDNPIGTTGWYIRHVHPYWFIKSLAVEPGVYSSIWDSVPEEDHAKIAEVMIRGFLEKTLEYDVAEWPRGEGNFQLEPASYEPQPYDGKGSIFDDRFNYADNFYKLIPEFLDRGVSPSLMDSLATWGEEVWPLGDWENLVDYTPPEDDEGDDGNDDEGDDGNDDDGNDDEGDDDEGDDGTDDEGDDEPAPLPVVALSSETAILLEAGFVGSVELTLDKALDNNLAVQLSVAGTAENGQDYEFIDTSIAVPSGQTQVTIPVVGIDDVLVENNETIILTLVSSPSYALDETDREVVITIEDDDELEEITGDFGDVNGDGDITAADAALILQYREGIITLTDEQLLVADVTGNGKVNVKDASMILRYVTGKISCFPVDAGCSIAVNQGR